MVSPASQRVLRARWYSGYRGIVCTLSNTGLSPSTAGLSRLVLLEIHFCNYLELLPCSYSVLQHPLYNAGRLSRIKGLGFSRFVRHYYGNCFFSSGYLDVSVPPLASPPRKERGVPAHHGGGLPHSEISGSACQRLPGAFRSVTTSFFGPGCQGIHHMPLFACDSSAFPLRSPPRCRVADCWVVAEKIVKQLFCSAFCGHSSHT